MVVDAQVVYDYRGIVDPQYLHRPPDNVGATAQAVAAFVLGNLMDRAVGMLRRRRAAREAGAPAGASHSVV